jgi:hypothetical protein
MAKTLTNPLKSGPGKAPPQTPCVGTLPWGADDTGMSETPANRLVKSNPRSGGRCVAVSPEAPDAGGMKRPPATQSRETKPRRSPPLGRAIKRALLKMDEAVRTITVSVGGVTKLAWKIVSFIAAVKAILWALGYLG